MASNKKQPARKLSSASDCLTGVPLRPGDLCLRIPAYDPTRVRRHQHPIPLKLFTCQTKRQSDAQWNERLGGPEETPDWRRYQRSMQTREQQTRASWHRAPAVLAQLDNAAARGDAGFSREELAVALNYWRNEPTECDHTPYWVERAARRVKRYALVLLSPTTA